jgi:cytochrome c oxidase subunit III
MSTLSTLPTSHDAHGPGDGHNPHLAHHFDTPEQQMASGKLGMWVFLATEILMFGGLFCAYSVYRHNHPEVFEYAHQWLNKTLGAINTVVLITSSLTMAWGVRLAQLGKQRGLIICLILTIVGGYGFMAIKSIEYKTKWEHNLGFAGANMYRPTAAGLDSIPGGGTPTLGRPPEHSEGAEHKAVGMEPPTGSAPLGERKPTDAGAQSHAAGAHPAESPAPDAHATQANAAGAAKAAPVVSSEYIDPNAGTPDAAVIRPVAQAPAGLAQTEIEARKHEMSTEELEAEYDKLVNIDKERTFTFFQIYFLMTGLHGIHVLVGMALIFWLLVKASPHSWRRRVKHAGLLSFGLFILYIGLLTHSGVTSAIGGIVSVLGGIGLLLAVIRPGAATVVTVPNVGDFGPDYYAPVDIVGLYWHLVDLIWIFLFPLLYLIH